MAMVAPVVCLGPLGPLLVGPPRRLLLLTLASVSPASSSVITFAFFALTLCLVVVELSIF